MVTAAIDDEAATSRAVSNASEGLASTFIGQFSAMSQAPYPINLSAPAVAAGMTAAAAAGYSASLATGAGLGAAHGAAHGGLTNVPSEQTYLLDKGERVLSPNQNSDLTNFLDNQRDESSQESNTTVVIENLSIDVLPNATSSQALLDMSETEMQEVVSEKIIRAIDSLYLRGVKSVAW